MTPMKTIMPDEDAVFAGLRSVIDPEVGMNIVDLGLVYDIRIMDGKLQIDITMTTLACPMSQMILDDARMALKTVVPNDAEVELNLVWEPPWNSAMMTQRAREHFGWE